MKNSYVLVILVVLPIILSGCVSETSEETLCSAAGGEWTQLSNTCVDRCEYVRAKDSVMCGMALTYGCECGLDKCWNGEACEDNNLEETSEDLCVASGGEVYELSCYCDGPTDFYNNCVIGACTCAPKPEHARTLKNCDCGDKCWNGSTCVTRPILS